MFENFINNAKKYFNDREIMHITEAYEFAEKVHAKQLRESGEPYITHPLAVASIILEEMHLRDLNSVIASLLHDTIEDTSVSWQDIKNLFNEDVADLVVGVTKIKDMNFTTKNETEQYNTCLLLKHLMKDYRVILIKLADRLHNMRTLQYKKKYKQQEKSLETMQIFCPLANRVGAYLIQCELEDLAFKYLYPSKYKEICSITEDYKERHKEEITEILKNVQKRLKENNINNDIRFVFKGNYNLWQEFKAHQRLSTIHDLIVYQIVVDDLEDCYLTLMHIHNMFKASGYFKDYISTPKPNDYKNIHTTVIGFGSDSKEHLVQFQICTKKMDLINEYGFAVLKELYPDYSIKEIQNHLANSAKFMKSLNEIDNLYEKDNNSFIKQVYDEILSEQIKVYSKDGDIYYIPKGSTVLDFAYQIHSEVGDQTIGALIKNKHVNKDYVLKEYDKIEILTDSNQKRQEKECLNFVITAYAKKKIGEGLND